MVLKCPGEAESSLLLTRIKASNQPAWICVVVCQRAIIVLTILLQGGNEIKS